MSQGPVKVPESPAPLEPELLSSRRWNHELLWTWSHHRSQSCSSRCSPELPWPPLDPELAEPPLDPELPPELEELPGPAPPYAGAGVGSRRVRGAACAEDCRRGEGGQRPKTRREAPLPNVRPPVGRLLHAPCSDDGSALPSEEVC